MPAGLRTGRPPRPDWPKRLPRIEGENSETVGTALPAIAVVLCLSHTRQASEPGQQFLTSLYRRQLISSDARYTIRHETLV